MVRRHLLKTQIRRGLLIVLLVLGPIAASHGRVFWKRPAGDAASAFDKAGRWTRVYQCPMEINGAPASLAVYTCPYPLAAMVASLGDIPGADISAGYNSASFAASDGSRNARLLLLGLPARNESIIFELIGPGNGNPAPSDASPVLGAALPAACSRVSTIVNGETGAALESIASALPPRQAFSIFTELLSGQGWKPLLPAASPGAAEEYFGMFQRRNSLCILTVGRALRENKTCVTIISKETNRQ